MNSTERYPRCILATCPLPWDEEGSLMPGLLTAEVQGLAQAGYRRLYLFGTAGEGYAVDEARFDEASRVFLDACAEVNVEPMLGVISTSLPTVIGRIERARGWGVRDFQISLPSWGPLADREVDRFFAETCGRFLDCRFLHYNLGRARRVLEPSDYARLAAAHPNLVATKQAGIASLETALALCDAAPDVRHFVGEGMFAALAPLRPCGLLISVGLVHPVRGRELYEAAIAGAETELARLRDEVEAVTRMVLHAGGEGPKMDGTYDKAIWKLHDPRFPLRLLPPYEGMSDAAFAEFRAKLCREVLRWAPGSTPS